MSHIYIAVNLCATGKTHHAQDRQISRILIFTDERNIVYHRIFSVPESISSFYYLTGINQTTLKDERQKKYTNNMYWEDIFSILQDFKYVYVNLPSYYFAVFPSAITSKLICVHELFSFDDNFFNLKELGKLLFNYNSYRYFEDVFTVMPLMVSLVEFYFSANYRSGKWKSILLSKRQNDESRNYIPFPHYGSICLSPFSEKLCICSKLIEETK